MESAKLMEIRDLKHYKSCQIVGISVSVGVCPAPLGLVQIRIGLSDPPGFGPQPPGWDLLRSGRAGISSDLALGSAAIRRRSAVPPLRRFAPPLRDSRATANCRSTQRQNLRKTLRVLRFANPSPPACWPNPSGSGQTYADLAKSEFRVAKLPRILTIPK